MLEIKAVPDEHKSPHIDFVSGYLETLSARARSYRQHWGRWQKSYVRQAGELVLIAAPFSTDPKQEFRHAQVECYEPALKLLAELYDKVAIPASTLAERHNGETAIAVGLLAAAGLCDVSPVAVRLSPEGKDFVERLSRLR